MRTEYLLTEEQKAELADIDRQIAALSMRKFDIYMCAPCRYIIEPRDEINQMALARAYLDSDRPLIPKHVIAMKFEDIPNRMEDKKNATLDN